MLGHTMGTIRGGAVVAWDANETMGTLSDRGMQDRHSSTVVDLIEQAAPSFGSVDGIRLGALDAYVRPQGDSHFDLLASDEDQIGRASCRERGQSKEGAGPAKMKSEEEQEGVRNS